MPSATALITGGGSGIGRAAAIVLARAGYRVALVGRREEHLRQTAALLPNPDEALLLPADLAYAAAARSIVDRTAAHFGRLDALINNAGEAPSLPIAAHTPEVLDRLYRINAIAPANSIAATWSIFTRQHSGCIVNISTLGTLDPFPGFFGYAASKAALSTMTMSCAREGAAIGVRAFCVAPGAVETGMFRAIIPESAFPRSRTLPPEAVAQVIADCVLGRRDGENGRTILLKNPD